MTTTEEELKSLIDTEQFLSDLLLPEKTPRVPSKIRQVAHRLLRHYPSKVKLKWNYDHLTGGLNETKRPR